MKKSLILILSLFLLLFISGCSNEVQNVNTNKVEDNNLKVDENKSNITITSSICGNGIAETGETSENCCLDVLCAVNFECANSSKITYCKELEIKKENTLSYNNVNNLILETSNLEKGYKITESYKLNEDNLQDVFNRMSSSKIKHFQIIEGYNIDFLNQQNKNQFNQLILIFNSTEKAEDFFNDRDSYYLESFEKKDFTYSKFDKLNYYFLKEDITGQRLYRFLILEDNVLIVNTYITQNFIEIDNYELNDLLNTEKDFFINYNLTKKELPNEIIIEKPYKLGSSPYNFNNLNVKTENGFKLAIQDYEIERKGDNWGKITKLKLVIENTGSTEIFPSVLIEVRDKSTDIANVPQKNMDLDVYLSGNSYIEVTLTPDLSFASWDKDKDIKVSLMEYDRTFVMNTQKVTANELKNIN